MEDQIDNEVWNGPIEDLPRPDPTAQHKRFVTWADRHMRNGRFANWAEKRTEWFNLRALPIRYTESSLTSNLQGIFPSRGGPPVMGYSMQSVKDLVKEAQSVLANVNEELANTDQKLAETDAKIQHWEQALEGHAADLQAYLKRKKEKADNVLTSLSIKSTTSAPKSTEASGAGGREKRSAQGILERHVIKSPRRDEPTGATQGNIGKGQTSSTSGGKPPFFPSGESGESPLEKCTPQATVAGASGMSFFAELAYRQPPQASSSATSANARDKQPQIENTSTVGSGPSAKALGKRPRLEDALSDGSNFAALPLLGDISSDEELPSTDFTALGDAPTAAEKQTVEDPKAVSDELPQLDDPPTAAEEQSVEEIKAAGFALFVLAESSLDDGTPDVWLSIAQLSEAAQDAIKTRLVEAVERKQAKTKFQRLIKRGDGEVTDNSPSCIECDCTQRNRRYCTHTRGCETPSTKQACDKCLDDKRPCGRLIFHPNGTGYAIGYSPVPPEHRPTATVWTDLAYWVRQVEPWAKLHTTRPIPAPARTKPSGSGNDYQTRAKGQASS
jgi:hypothetical protein